MLGWLVPGALVIGLGSLLARLPPRFLGQFCVLLCILLAILVAVVLNTRDRLGQAKRFIKEHHGDVDLDGEEEMEQAFNEACQEDD